MREWRARLVRPALLLAGLFALSVLAGCAHETGTDGARADAMPPTSRAGAATAPEAEGFAAIPAIVDRVQPSVVAVLVDGPQQPAEGSGVIWSSDGAIVTNHHVVGRGTRITVAFASGERVAAKLVAADPLTDLAVLDVDRRGLPAAEFVDRLPDVGEMAIALGNPLGFENTVTAGIISGVDRSIPSGGRTPALVNLVQTDAPISPGNSGGALVGGDARVLGINVAFIPPQARAVSIGFAIPAPTVTDVVEQLLSAGEVRHAFLGVRASPVTRSIAEAFELESNEGALVLSVVRGSPAAQAGMRPGDVIVGIERTAVRAVEDLYSVLRSREPGDEVTIKLRRGSDERTLAAMLEEHPAS